ncbi:MULTISPECIES: transcriptional regulator [Enterobacteriaceae]|uniref:transcriptional regulator n=1 Tax=Enterobacteriaceae TaxID=543 RepID=UPI002FD53C39
MFIPISLYKKLSSGKYDKLLHKVIQGYTLSLCSITFGIFMINQHVKRAIDILGGQAALARACGVTQPAVFRWLNGSRVKADHVMSIVKATGGEVKAYQIRPDLPDTFPHPGNEV